MIDREVVDKGLAALSVAAGELLEDNQGKLVSALPTGKAERRQLFDELEQLGVALATLARAGSVLTRHGE
ncbi:MAG: hypothetical protein EOO64_06640 [Massilia sp.]|nr:MAG: hypothetical protein EOO64_06640 [Massilia sp.]